MLVFNANPTMHAKHDEDENICQEYNSARRPRTNAITPLILQLNQMMPQEAWKQSAHCEHKTVLTYLFNLMRFKSLDLSSCKVVLGVFWKFWQD